MMCQNDSLKSVIVTSIVARVYSLRILRSSTFKGLMYQWKIDMPHQINILMPRAESILRGTSLIFNYFYVVRYDHKTKLSTFEVIFFSNSKMGLIIEILEPESQYFYSGYLGWSFFPLNESYYSPLVDLEQEARLFHSSAIWWLLIWSYFL